MFTHLDHADLFDLAIAGLTNIGAALVVLAYGFWYWRLRRVSDTNLRPLILGIAVAKAAVWFWSLSGILLILDGFSLPVRSLPARLFFLAAVGMHVWVVVRMSMPSHRLSGPFEPTGVVRGKVLIVEDDEAQRTLYYKALVPAGFTCVTVKTGEEALDIIMDYMPDVVIVDMLLPDMDGIDFVAAARKKGFRGNAIAMSGAMARFDDEHLVHFVEKMQKPLRVSQLVAAVTSAVALGKRSPG